MAKEALHLRVNGRRETVSAAEAEVRAALDGNLCRCGSHASAPTLRATRRFLAMPMRSSGLTSAS